jgi:hypothetical protein
MKHFRRAAAVIIAVLVVLLVIPRLLPPTTSLETYGFYPKRSQESAQVWASRPVEYANATNCSTCHADKYTAWVSSKHSGVNCQDCHGPSQTHIEEGVTQVAAISENSACVLCHGKIVGRPGSFPQIDLAQHGGQASCVTCHDPHNPKIPVPPAVPHNLQGLADCLTCHGTAGIVPLPNDHEGRTSNTCLSCHGSK